MTDKTKQFPLRLASIQTPSGKANGSRPHRMPEGAQTAVRNAALHQQARREAGTASGISSTAGAVPEAFHHVPDSVRKAMVARIAGKGVRNPRVLKAMEAVPRHHFLDSGLASQAYIDASLPIGHHQTISQPYIVARMLELLCEGSDTGMLGKVLEIGTGCGYQAAVLSLIAAEVYSIERIRPLHELAKSNLRPMRIPNIRLHYGDGMLGLPQAAPFDGIILAAAGMEIPPDLLQQISVGGKLIAPVGGQKQVLQLISRTSQTEWSSRTVEECHFVPLRPGTAG